MPGGFEDWVSIEDFGYANEEWLRGFLELPNGIPSHDTLSDVIGRMDRHAFASAFGEWVRAGLPELAGHHVAVDGKSLRGSRGDDGTVHLISAYATQARFVLAANAIPDKENEITAIPGLLVQLDLTGAIVMIDAMGWDGMGWDGMGWDGMGWDGMGCHKNIAKIIVAQKADYVLALKENHPGLHEDVKLWLDDSERRYYLCSITDVSRIALTIRHHWAIENKQHRILDVQFGEDAHRARKDHSAANLGMIRRTALNLLQQDTSNKWSIRRRKMRANFDLAYRESILFKPVREINS